MVEAMGGHTVERNRLFLSVRRVKDGFAVGVTG